MNQSTSITHINEKIKRALYRLYEDDELLFKVNGGKGASERCIVFRLAMYLQMNFQDYIVDCDYNASCTYTRQEDGTYSCTENHGKPIRNEDGTSTDRFPDVIIHKRNFPERYNPLEDGLLNDYICFEIKKSRTYRGRDKDRNNLRQLTSSYGYLYGFHIILHKNIAKTKWTIFENGNIIRDEALVFETHATN